MNQKTALITGVSGGIGLALVHKLLQESVKVVGIGRTNPNIDHKNFTFEVADIRDEKAVTTAISNGLSFLNGRIDYLINNAGLGIFKKLHRLTTEDWMTQFDTNVHGIYFTCKNIVPIMREQGSGHIINISSIAGLQGLPEATAYAGTKFAVRGISQSLFQEVRKYGVKVTCVFPGSVNTNFFENYDFVTANDTMMNPNEVADTLFNLLNTSSNFVPSELEIRPINPNYKG